MSERPEHPEPDEDAAGGADDTARLRFKGIVEAAPSEENAPKAYRDSFPRPYRGPERRREGAGWNAGSRQMWLGARLCAVFLFCAIVIGWPVGDALAHLTLNSSLEGWSFYNSLTLEAFLLAVIIPTLVLLIGYIMSRQMQMMSAAESIANAAQQFISPDASAADNARSVGAVVKGQMDALNVGLDGALTRLASVEALIRQHVEAIETAGASIETSASGAVGRVADERARLIDLTEHLNAQADAFAAAIAAKAQASIEALHSADDLSDRAQSHLDERLARLDSAAQNAVTSFNALCDALQSADESFRASTSSIETSAAETRRAIDTATKVSEAAAETAARNAANVGASATRASEEAKKAADASIEFSRQEAERAASAAVEATGKALESVKESTRTALSAASEDAGKATSAAGEVSEAAKKVSEAAARAAQDVTSASEEARRQSDSALSANEQNAEKIEARNRSLAEARAALEHENTRLESLIEEQRSRADRLADAIATQTERLSKLAEAQLREQETSARIAKTKAQEEALAAAAAQDAAERAEEEKAKKLAAEERAAEARAAEERKIAEAEKARKNRRKPASQGAPTSSDESVSDNPPARNDGVLNLGEAARNRNRAGGGRRREPPVSGGERAQESAPPEATRRDKQSVSWREILDAAEEADPLDLAAISSTPPQPGPGAAASAGAADAMKIISRLQTFTYDLETRLYGDPPPALRERFERGDRNVFANRILRLNEADVKRRIRAEAGRDKDFERDVHAFLQGFEQLLEGATTSQTADEDLEEYLSSPLGRVYLLIGATVGYFA